MLSSLFTFRIIIFCEDIALVYKCIANNIMFRTLSFIWYDTMFSFHDVFVRIHKTNMYLKHWSIQLRPSVEHTWITKRKLDTRESFVKSIADQHVLCLSSILRGHYYSIIKHTLHKEKSINVAFIHLGKCMISIEWVKGIYQINSLFNLQILLFTTIPIRQISYQLLSWTYMILSIIENITWLSVFTITDGIDLFPTFCHLIYGFVYK